MRIGIAQIDCEVGNVEVNCGIMAGMAAMAAEAGCDAVVFPELADVGGDTQAILALASEWDRGPCTAMQELAGDLGLAVICGLSERDGPRVFNSLAVIDRRGMLVGKYRKAHLFSAAPVFEHEHLSAGDALEIVGMGDLNLGLMLCYDIRFPEMARVLALRGANVLIVPAAWPFPRLEHWKTLTACRAIENQAYVVAANRVGSDGPLTFCGTSRLLDPYGVPLASASEIEPALIVGEVTHQRAEKTRSRMQVFRDRREDLYGFDGGRVSRS